MAQIVFFIVAGIVGFAGAAKNDAVNYITIEDARRHARVLTSGQSLRYTRFNDVLWNRPPRFVV